jgi:DNA excision repair protein ERCC-4
VELITICRQDLYKRGGLMSVTSRILVVDMLQSDIPIDLITGILVLHAEKYVPSHSLNLFDRHPVLHTE